MMEQMRERVARAIAPFLEGGREFDKMPVNRLQLREWARQAMCGFNDATQDDAYEAADALQPEIDRRVAEEKADLESKFRCVVSHATGGNFQDIDASLNEISVRISQFRTQLWEQAKQSGAKEEKAKLLDRLREGLKTEIANAYDAGATDVHDSWVRGDNGGEADFGEAASDYAASVDVQAMLAQSEKDNSHEQG